MSRLVGARLRVAGAVQPAAAGESPVKDYLERVSKYIPAEIVAAYTTSLDLIDATVHPHKTEISLGVFVFFLICVPLYYFKLRVTTDPFGATAAQMFIASVSFVIWAYALGKGFPVYAGFYDSLYSGLVLTGYSFLAGVYVPTRSQ